MYQCCCLLNDRDQRALPDGIASAPAKINRLDNSVRALVDMNLATKVGGADGDGGLHRWGCHRFVISAEIIGHRRYRERFRPRSLFASTMLKGRRARTAEWRVDWQRRNENANERLGRVEVLSLVGLQGRCLGEPGERKVSKAGNNQDLP